MLIHVNQKINFIVTSTVAITTNNNINLELIINNTHT